MLLEEDEDVVLPLVLLEDEEEVLLLELDDDFLLEELELLELFFAEDTFGVLLREPELRVLAKHVFESARDVMPNNIRCFFMCIYPFKFSIVLVLI